MTNQSTTAQRARRAGFGLLTGVAALMIHTPPADAAVGRYTIVNTGNIGVKGRYEPKVNSAWRYGPSEGHVFSAICQTIGEPMGNFGNTLWFKIKWGDGDIFVNDTFTDSPHNAVDPPIAGIPMCGQPVPVAPQPVAPQPSEKVISKDCSGWWIGWAQYKDDGNQIKITMRPTKRAWAVLWKPGSLTSMWDAYFACLGWQDGFDRLSQDQWNSIWLQHRCHFSLGGIGRLKSGDTFDYESDRPNRGDVRTALRNGCN